VRPHVNAVKIALLQINPVVGDLAGNARLIAEAACEAGRKGATLAVTPELALVGYLPRDLLLSSAFVADSWTAAAALARDLNGQLPVLVGLPEPNPSNEGRPLFNTAVMVHEGRTGERFRKALLPTYDVFDEDRTSSRIGALRFSNWADDASGSASAKTSGTIATSGNGGAITSIRSKT